MHQVVGLGYVSPVKEWQEVYQFVVQSVSATHDVNF